MLLASTGVNYVTELEESSPYYFAVEEAGEMLSTQLNTICLLLEKVQDCNSLLPGNKKP